MLQLTNRYTYLYYWFIPILMFDRYNIQMFFWELFFISTIIWIIWIYMVCTVSHFNLSSIIEIYIIWEYLPTLHQNILWDSFNCYVWILQICTTIIFVIRSVQLSSLLLFTFMACCLQELKSELKCTVALGPTSWEKVITEL